MGLKTGCKEFWCLQGDCTPWLACILEPRPNLLCPVSDLGICFVMQDGLWWLPLSSGAADRLRRVLMPAAGLGALAGLQGRVLLPAFGSYLAMPAPWSPILVSVVLFGSAGAALVLHEGAHQARHYRFSFTWNVYQWLLSLLQAGSHCRETMSQQGYCTVHIKLALGLALWCNSSLLNFPRNAFAKSIP